MNIRQLIYDIRCNVCQELIEARSFFLEHDGKPFCKKCLIERCILIAPQQTPAAPASAPQLKRFLLFEYDDFYPGGGWRDFTGDFDAEHEARARRSNGTKENWHIVDTLAPGIIAGNQ